MRILFCGTCEYSVIHLRALLQANARRNGIGLGVGGSIGGMREIPWNTNQSKYNHDNQDARLMCLPSTPTTPSTPSTPSTPNTIPKWKVDVLTPPRPPAGLALYPLQRFALQQGLRLLHAPPKTLRHWEPPQGTVYDFGVVVSFGYFLPPALIQSFRLGAVNVHPSLLPQYRGAAPMQHAIWNGDRETGVSIIELHPTRWDAGRVFQQVRVPFPTNYPTFSSWLPEIGRIGAHALVDVLQNWSAYQHRAVEQSDLQSGADLRRAPKIRREHAHVRWHQHSAVEMFRKHCAFGHQYELYADLRCKQQVHLCRLQSPSETDRELGLLASASSPMLESCSNPPPGTQLLNPITNTLFVKTMSYSSSTLDSKNLPWGSQWLGIRSLRLPRHTLAMDARSFASHHYQFVVP